MTVTAKPNRNVMNVGERQKPLTRSQKKLFKYFVLPALLVYVVVLVAPSIAAVWISFTEWSGRGTPKFVGFHNFAVIFRDRTFVTSFVNTCLILFVVGAGIFIVSFFIMAFIRQMTARSFIRSVIFFPNIASGVVLAVIWGFIFQHKGALDGLLALVGIHNPPEWLAPENLLTMIMIGLLWMHAGLFTTILVAALDRIPASLFEAADLAGANAIQRLRYVTIPLTWEVFGVASILWTITSIKIFEFIYTFAAGVTGFLPPTEIWNTAIFTYGEAFASLDLPRYGAASASAVVSLVLAGLVVVILHRLFRREVFEF